MTIRTHALRATMTIGLCLAAMTMAAQTSTTTTTTPDNKPNTETQAKKPHTPPPPPPKPLPPPPKPLPPPPRPVATPPKPVATPNPAPKGNGETAPKFTMPERPNPSPTGNHAPHPNVATPANPPAAPPSPAGANPNPRGPANPFTQPPGSGNGNTFHPATTHAGAATPQLVHPAGTGILGRPAPAGAHPQMLKNGNAIQRRPSGQVSDVFDSRRGMSIHNNLNGSRQITTVRPDGTRIVAMGAHAGFVEKPFTVGGNQFAERTYTQNGVTTHQFYQQSTYQGVPIHVYTPAHYYPPATYGWVYHAPVQMPVAGAVPPAGFPTLPVAPLPPGAVMTPSGAIQMPNGTVIAPAPAPGQGFFASVAGWLTGYVTCVNPRLGQFLGAGMNQFGVGPNGQPGPAGSPGGQNPYAAGPNPYAAGQPGNQGGQNPYAAPPSGDQSGQNPYASSQPGDQSGQNTSTPGQNPYAASQPSDQSGQNPYAASQTGDQSGQNTSTPSQNPYAASQPSDQSGQNPYAASQPGDQGGQNPYAAGQPGFAGGQGAVPVAGPGNPCPQAQNPNPSGGNQNAPNPSTPANPYTAGDQGQNPPSQNPAAPASPWVSDQGQAGQNPPATAGPVLSPEVEQLVANEIKNQVALENAEAAQNAQGQTPDPASSGVARMLGDGQQHVFVVGTPIDVVDATGAECALGAGDVLQTIAPPAPTDKTASLTVLASNPNECAVSNSVAVGFDDLQEMQNHMRQSIDQGLDTIQQNQGQPGIPAAPATAAAPPAPASFAPVAPPPDPNANSEVSQQNQQANQAVNQAAAQAPPQ